MTVDPSADSLTVRDSRAAAAFLEALTARWSSLPRGDLRRDAPSSLGPLTDEGKDLRALVDYVLSDVAPARMDTFLGAFMAYIPGGNLGTSTLADALAASESVRHRPRRGASSC